MVQIRFFARLLAAQGGRMMVTKISGNGSGRAQ